METAAAFDPYLVLGVRPTASDAEIRAAYRALVAKYHPDRHQGNPLADLASVRMAEINRAYETLSKARSPARPAGAPAARGRGGREASTAAGAGKGTRRGAGGDEARVRATSSSRSVVGRIFRAALFVLAIPFLLRMAPKLIRVLGGLGRLTFDGVVRLRTTPLIGLGVVTVTAVLIFLVVRRRRSGGARPHKVG